MKPGFQRARTALKKIYKRLQVRFSLTRLLRTRDELVVLRPGGRDVEWVVSRGLSLFLVVDCTGVPRKRRESFVESAARRAAPFADPGWHVAWMGERAMVWVWPMEELTASGRESEEALADSSGLRFGDVVEVRRFTPESLLRGEPMEAGIDLLACSDGVEARAWHNGVLQASNWWPSAPDQAAWTTFCRGAGVPPCVVPEIRQAAWRESPWTVDGHRPFGEVQSLIRQYGGYGLAALMLAAATFQIGGIAHLAWAKSKVERQINNSRAQVSDILSARNHAEDDLAAVHRLIALRPPATQIGLLAEVVRLLDGKHASLTSWSMADPTHLEMVVNMPNSDPRALVLAFQSSGNFADVAADVGHGGKDQLIIRARIRAKDGEQSSSSSAGRSS